MYSPTKENIWTGRIESIEGELGWRWHQKIKLIDLAIEQLPKLNRNEKGIVIIGFESDEGVRRNKGRTGAKEGPKALRNACCNHANHFNEHTIIYDGGNVSCENEGLEDAQSELRFLISKVISNRYLPFVFGGGHEVAYPHFMGLYDAISAKKSIGIINIDAHFDLRIPDNKSTSGTPFYEISKECDSGKMAFKYFCIGIQQSSNTQALFKRADELGVEYFLTHDCQNDRLKNIISKIHDFFMNIDMIYLTICLDVFDVSFAPGVSSSSAIGLRPDIALIFIKEIAKTGKIISANIAELNPSLDQNDKTAKLAAKLTYEILTDVQT